MAITAEHCMSVMKVEKLRIIYKGSSALIFTYENYLCTLKHYSICYTITMLSMSNDFHILIILMRFVVAGWTMMSFCYQWAKDSFLRILDGVRFPLGVLGSQSQPKSEHYQCKLLFYAQRPEKQEHSFSLSSGE